MAGKERRFSLGLDYGTESARAVLLDVSNGKMAASASSKYKSGVIEGKLPSGIKLPKHWALQDPADWLNAFQSLSKSLLKKSKINPEQIVGIGIDFTSCTVLPAASDGKPLCFQPNFKRTPHAWPKLWKHHGAQEEAEAINKVAVEMGEKFLNKYGGKISPEWLIPKLLEIMNGAPEIAQAMDKFVEAQDWLVWQVTGTECRSACGAGYKGCWSKNGGFPDDIFLNALKPGLADTLKNKVGTHFYAPGHRAGTLCKSWALKTGLREGTPVGVSIIDAHAAVLGAGISDPGKMVLCIGTSACHLLLSDNEREVPGISGVVEDGILPGFFGYEAGQAAVGDIFGWFSKVSGKSFMALERRAKKLKPGESGLIALDWWNGNRSVLSDANLTGMILGLTLTTQPHEIYRALVEATAMGTRKIVETMEQFGVPVKDLIATGGIAEKSPMLLQIYADILNRPIELVQAKDLCARGAAVLGAIAAEDVSIRGGVQDVVRRMSPNPGRTYVPEGKNASIYETLYREYLELHDYFGTGGNGVMQRLRDF